jgi:ATP-dependent Lon protease
MKNEIQSKVKMDIDRQQREYFLNQQMRTIQDELGRIIRLKHEINEFERACKIKSGMRK